MTITGALERFNEYIRAGFLEWQIGLLKRRMEKMEIGKEAQHLKAAKERSTCEERQTTQWTEATMTSRNPTRLSTSSSADYPADGNKRLLVEKS
jgi:hypothetical protein